MSDREKLIGALGKVAWAYVFFYWDINFFVVNLLPDWAGWLLVWNTLLVLGKEIPTAKLLQNPAQILFFWGLGAEILEFFGVQVISGNTTVALLGAVKLVMGVLNIYVNFQLFTDLASLSDRNDLGQGRQLRALRVINVLIPTLMSLPFLEALKWFYWAAVWVQLIAMVWTGMALFSLRKALRQQEESPETQKEAP
jgi:hypothetical protein